MINKLRRNISRIQSIVGGWKSSRKILVIESDDWGSVRIPNKAAYNTLLKNGILVDKCPFLSFDHFEQIEDFKALFDTLNIIKMKYGKAPKITANFNMANPDFSAIEHSDFNHYKFIDLKSKLKSENLLEEYLEQLEIGMKNKYFQPQLHGREHVNIGLWMQFLKKNSSETRLAFKNDVYGISTTISSENRRSFLPALDFENDKEWETITKPSLIEGQKLFSEFFGYNSRSFIAPNYTWDSNVEKILSENDVEFIQSSTNQFVSLGSQKTEGKVIEHRTGERNSSGQIYLVRNSIFEPSTVTNKPKHLAKCLSQINMALFFRKPAILSMHRLNFMGGMNENNRTENLALFNELIEKLINKHPTIEFLSSDELGDIIKKNKNG